MGPWATPAWRAAPAVATQISRAEPGGRAAARTARAVAAPAEKAGISAQTPVQRAAPVPGALPEAGAGPAEIPVPGAPTVPTASTAATAQTEFPRLTGGALRATAIPLQPAPSAFQAAPATAEEAEGAGGG